MDRSIKVALVLLIVIAVLTLMIVALGIRAIVKRVRSFFDATRGLVASGPQEQAT